jgi:quercetin dioxygenase-like cupin family protein
MRTLLSTAALSGLVVSALSAQASSASPALHWGPAQAVFPKGARMAVVNGDPGKAGTFTIELSMPGGYRIPPHFHPTDEHVEIKKGTFLVGMGDVFDAKQTKPMVVGDTGTIPAEGHHFAETRGAVIVAVTAMGPFAMTYVRPQDDPRNAKTAGY